VVEVEAVVAVVEVVDPLGILSVNNQAYILATL
jgi:hypothetical protein